MPHALAEFLLLNAHADVEHPLLQEISMESGQKVSIQIQSQRFSCSISTMAESSSTHTTHLQGYLYVSATALTSGAYSLKAHGCQ